MPPSSACRRRRTCQIGDPPRASLKRSGTRSLRSVTWPWIQHRSINLGSHPAFNSGPPHDDGEVIGGNQAVRLNAEPPTSQGLRRDAIFLAKQSAKADV